MSELRIEQAILRIETALGRIAVLADNSNPAPTSVSGLVVKHENLRETTSNILKELDDLIDGLSK